MYAGTKAVMFAWLCFKHFWLAVWWLFRFEIWIFYYWCFARWLFGLRLKFPGYYDIWFKNKPKEIYVPTNKKNSTGSYKPAKKEEPSKKSKQKEVVTDDSANEIRIPKIDNNMVKIYNQNGFLLGTIRPGQGNPVYADVNNKTGEVMITTSLGSVFVYTKTGSGRMGGNGGLQTNKDVVRATLQGNDMLVEYENGKRQLRSMSGTLIREF